MLTYMDTVTLLVTLFVILLSFSTINIDKFTTIAEAMSLAKYGKGILTGAVKPTAVTPVAPKTVVEEPGPSAAKAEAEASAMVDDLRAELAKQGLTDMVEMTVHENVVDLQLNESVLFPAGEATLTDRGLSVVDRLTPLLVASGVPVAVEGHTDNVPISTEIFPSNWELSAGRAASVARAFIARGIAADRIHISGYAETRPVAPNDTPAGRSQNRRVNLVLKMSDKATDAAAKKTR